MSLQSRHCMVQCRVAGEVAHRAMQQARGPPCPACPDSGGTHLPLAIFWESPMGCDTSRKLNPGSTQPASQPAAGWDCASLA